MTLITFSGGGPILRSGMVGTEQACCCGNNACPCPVTLDNCTLTVDFVGGTIADPAAVSPVQLTQFMSGEFSGRCGVIAGQETLRFCAPGASPAGPCSAGIQAVIECDSCCQVADSEGRQPGDAGYVDTREGVNCTIVDSTFTGGNQTNCDDCYEGAFAELPTDIVLTLDCDPGCGNEFP